MPYKLRFHALALQEWQALDSSIREPFKKKLAERLEKAGVAHRLVRGHGLTHGYCNSGSLVPRAQEIVGDAGQFLAALPKN